MRKKLWSYIKIFMFSMGSTGVVLELFVPHHGHVNAAAPYITAFNFAQVAVACSMQAIETLRKRKETP